jgi:hypothetical protein
MRSLIRSVVVGLMLAASLTPCSAIAQRYERRPATRLCRQNFRNAVRGARYLRGPERRRRMEQARIERTECERLAHRR